MHNHDDKQSSWMKWLMMICCVVPLLLIVLLGLGGKSFGTSNWTVFGGIVAMAMVHFFIMGRSHKSRKDNKNHSDHGCCR